MRYRRPNVVPGPRRISPPTLQPRPKSRKPSDGLARMTTAGEPRRLYPAVDDPSALRVELSLQGIRACGVALIVTDDPAAGWP
jgi:hypothetical protein